MRHKLTMIAALALVMGVLPMGLAAASSHDDQVFTDGAAFMATTGAEAIAWETEATVLGWQPFGAELGDYSCAATDVTTPDEEVTFTFQGALLCYIGPEWNAPLSNTNPKPTGPTLVANGEDDFTMTIDLATPTYGVGIGLLTNFAAAETITVNYVEGPPDVFTDVDLDTAPNRGDEFVGFWGDRLIESIEVDTTGGASQNEGITGVWLTGCSSTFTTDLIADGPDSGFLLDVGDVTVWNTATTLYVEVTTTDGWEFSEAHVHATTEGDFPVTKRGSPKVGQFFYNESYDPWQTTDLFTFDLDGESSVEVAVHLKVWDTNSTDTVVFWSDGADDGGTTQVTSTNTLQPVPFLAVDAWEAFGDPDDSSDSLWDTLVSYDFQYGDWIWESYRVLDPTVPQSVSFAHGFEVPGPPVGPGMVYVANDNTYSASMNGVFLGDQLNYNNWPTAGAYEFDAVMGLNTFTVDAANYGDARFNVDSNPGGLIFEGSVEYYDRSESAWGSGDQFDGGNWAMKFTYDRCDAPD